MEKERKVHLETKKKLEHLESKLKMTTEELESYKKKNMDYINSMAAPKKSQNNDYGEEENGARGAMEKMQKVISKKDTELTT